MAFVQKHLHFMNTKFFLRNHSTALLPRHTLSPNSARHPRVLLCKATPPGTMSVMDLGVLNKSAWPPVGHGE